MTSPFNWKATPSVLASDLAPLKNGKTRSQVATQAVARKEAREGKSPGTIRNLSPKSEAQIRPRKGKGR